MRKRLLSLILALAVAVPLFAVTPVFAEGTYDEYDKDYEILTAIGIITSGDNFNSAAYITRGEAAKYIVRVAGAPVSKKSTEMFTDVAVSNDNYEYINTAASRKYINGVDNDMFMPDEEIKPLDFAIALMNVLGYSEVGAIAGYSDGWRGLANRLGLLNSVNLTESLTGESAVRMLMTALECEPVKLYSVGETNYYKSEEDVTLLEDVHDIIKARGIVDSDAYTSTYTQEGAGDGFCGIDGITFLADDVDATVLLGRCVDYYYKDSEDEAYKRLIYAGEYRNTEVVLNYDEIGKVSTTSVTKEDEDGRNKDYKLSKSAAFIYNYKQRAISAELMTPVYGSMTLVDNDRDGVYDIVIVKEYKQLRVDYVSSKTGNIIGSDGTVLELDPDVECDYVAYNGEAKVSAKSVSAGMTINYIISDGAGRNIIEMRLSRDKIEGAAEMIDEDTIVIDGESYARSPYINLTGVNIGTYYTWYIDCNGAASFAERDKLYVYGYLNWVYKDEFDGTVHVKIFTENARWVDLELRDKIKFSGESGVKAEDVYETFGTVASAYRQMVTYRVNADAQVVELNTAKQYEAWSAAEAEAIENGTFRVRKFTSQQYRTSISAFGTDARVSGSKIIFFIPDQTDKSVDESEFFVGDTSYLGGDDIYSGYAYDCDETGGAPVCMLDAKYLTAEVSANASLMVVKRVIKTIDEDNDLVYNVKGMYKGYDVEISTSSQGNFEGIDKLEFGDIIQFAINPEGEMSAYSKRFDYSANYGAKKFYNGAAYHNYTIGGGTVADIDTEANMMVFDSASKAMFSFMDGCIYYLVDTKNNEMKTTDLSDVLKGRYIVAKAQYFRTREVVIYI